MKITICLSLNFTNNIKSVKEMLEKLGHEVFIPSTSLMIFKDEVTLAQIIKEKETGAIVERAIKQNAIRDHYEKIKNADAILVCNYDKNGIKDYIGGNVFLEMGFAYILGKKIFLLNPIPKINYREEILVMQPVILNGDLSKIV